MVAIFPAATKGGGQCIGFPDVCKTPAPPAPFAPIPYPNIVMVNQAKKTASKVKIKKKEVVTMGSEVGRSSGDEAGTMKGMISQKNMDKAKPKKGSGKVSAQGEKVIPTPSMWTQNGAPNGNVPAGAMAMVSQGPVLVSA